MHKQPKLVFDQMLIFYQMVIFIWLRSTTSELDDLNCFTLEVMACGLPNFTIFTPTSLTEKDKSLLAY